MSNPVSPIPAAPTAPLKKTALNAAHRAMKSENGGLWRMGHAGGVSGGVGGGLIAERMAVRTGVGLFDVRHMGEIQFRGPGALAAVQRVSMNDASRPRMGRRNIRRCSRRREHFVDDMVHRLSANDYLLVVNAGTKDKDFAWIREQVGA